ncbi:phosphomannomutase/phosphoglucomutase [Candidatus Woesebacteria bacterium]|nr:phosphomannomutase/phosphoglucomutase [Candidatus Woesebacteria bacterium]
MIVDPSIFKAYDIRGVYGTNIFDATAPAIAKGFAAVLKPTTVVVGRDARVSSPQLHAGVIAGLTSIGVNVIDVGMVSTDMYYYACAQKGLPGIMITASHNPAEYNGFKMVKKIPYLLSGDEGIQDIRTVIETDAFPADAATPGTVEKWEIMAGFIEKMASLIDLTALKPMKVIIDTANGMVGPSATELFKLLPQIEMIPMYFTPDGTFPNHGGDPLIEENRKELMERVVAEKADLGFACDPDGDRFFCIDAKGRFVSGDFMTALLSEYFLKKHPGATIVYDIRASHAVPNMITAAGGKPLYNRVGHAFIKKRMSDESAVFAGEVTGHYYFKDFYLCDSGIAPMLYVMDMLSKGDKKLDQLLDTLGETYFISGEINTKGVDGKAVLARIEEKYSPSAQEVLKVDGVSIIYPEWNFNVRTSNTEPLVRLNLEATSKALMEEKRDEVLAVIRA